MNMLIMFLVSTVVAMLVAVLPILLSKKVKEISQIESGFEGMTKTTLKSFSLNFFYILIIFVVFDLELFLVFPLMLKKNLVISVALSLFILFTLTLEWSVGKISWKS